MLYQAKTLNCNGRILDLSSPKIMGVLNTTPDSFFDGGKYEGEVSSLKQVEKMLIEGADIIDIGGMSSRPGAEIVSSEEEYKRVIPVVKTIVDHFPNTIISVDTVRASIAKEAALNGAGMVNDISGASIDSALLDVVEDLSLPYVLMHMKGLPENMQDKPDYKSVCQEVLDFLINKLGVLRAKDATDIIVDPGFGFGKTLEHNYELLKNLRLFKILECPILVGLSRKSMIHRALDVNPADALNGSTALHMLALQNGADILRVHDVKEAVEVRQLFSLYQSAEEH